MKFKMSAALIGMVVLIVVVVGVYQFVVHRTTVGYNSLLNGDVAVLMHAGKLKNAMLQARREEKDFILRHDLKYLQLHREDIRSLKAEAAAIAGISSQVGRQSMAGEADDIIKLADLYRADFVKLVAAQQEAGLSPETGRQGEFRKVAHSLQKVMPEHDVESIYAAYWAMRRGEKDYCRLNSASNKVRFHRLRQSFAELLAASPFDAVARRQTLAALTEYQQAAHEFTAAVDTEVVQHNHDVMIDSAKKMETAINSVRVPGVTAMMLDIRKHEKDFILRRDKQYADKLHTAIATLNAAFAKAGVLPQHITEVREQLAAYSRSFDALVVKYDEIRMAEDGMRQAVHQIEPLVDNIYKAALQGTARQNASLAEGGNSLTWLALITAIISVLLAILVAFCLTRSTLGDSR